MNNDELKLKDAHYCSLCRGRIHITYDGRHHIEKVYDKRCYDCEKPWYGPYKPWES